jgi:hypothetical protein
MTVDFHYFLWQRDDSLRKDESNDGVKFLCHNSKDNPFKDPPGHLKLFRIRILFSLKHSTKYSTVKMIHTSSSRYVTVPI